MFYKIYQKQLYKGKIKKFVSIPEGVTQINLKEEGYKEYYSSNIDMINDWQALSELFEIFNNDIPLDFRGHSLSVSDIVQLDNKYFYCNSIGWQEIEVI